MYECLVHMRCDLLHTMMRLSLNRLIEFFGVHIFILQISKFHLYSRKHHRLYTMCFALLYTACEWMFTYLQHFPFEVCMFDEHQHWTFLFNIILMYTMTVVCKLSANKICIAFELCTLRLNCQSHQSLLNHSPQPKYCCIRRSLRLKQK